MIINAKMNLPLFVVYESAEAGGRSRLGSELADLSLIPAFALDIGIFLDNVLGVEVVHANLPL